MRISFFAEALVALGKVAFFELSGIKVELPEIFFVGEVEANHLVVAMRVCWEGVSGRG